MNLGSNKKPVLVLISCRDENDLVRVPTDGDPFVPGMLIADADQALRKVAEKLLRPDLAPFISIEHIIQDGIQLPSGEHADLVVADIPRQHLTAPMDWATVPSLIRGMPKTRNRLAYLKAWQILTGAHQETLEAVEIDEDLRRRLKDSFKNNPN